MILVFGKNGQVGTALRQALPEAIFVGRDVANFLQPQSVLKFLDQYRPNVIVNAAAYTQVDKAESEQDAAMAINAKTPQAIAEWCKRHGALLVHYSTDYVFDGTGEKPWIETDQPNPINLYGLSKWEGEKSIQASGCKNYIFRVSWVYSPWGQNFKKTILRLAQERTELKIVADQWGAPTKAEDIATETKKVLERYLHGAPLEFGIHHWRFSEYTTWHQFAVNIVEEAKKEGLSLKVKYILPIHTEAYPTPAKRPKNSRLGSMR